MIFYHYWKLNKSFQWKLNVVLLLFSQIIWQFDFSNFFLIFLVLIIRFCLFLKYFYDKNQQNGKKLQQQKKSFLKKSFFFVSKKKEDKKEKNKKLTIFFNHKNYSDFLSVTKKTEKFWRKITVKNREIKLLMTCQWQIKNNFPPFVNVIYVLYNILSIQFIKIVIKWKLIQKLK